MAAQGAAKSCTLQSARRPWKYCQPLQPRNWNSQYTPTLPTLRFPLLGFPRLASFGHV